MKFKSIYHKKHYEAWILQSEHPEWEKSDNPLFKESQIFACYACDEACYSQEKNYYISLGICSYCPIDWETDYCIYEGSIYDMWENERNPEKRTIMSEIIALKEWKIK